MCRNIKTLYNYDPPANEEDVYNASLQFVRKVSGFHKPSQANETAFHTAVGDISKIAAELLDSLVTSAPKRNREADAAAAKARSAKRFNQ